MAQCRHIKDDGSRCRAAALRDEPYCLFHSPARKKEVEEHRRLGGLRRRRERMVGAAFDYEGLQTHPQMIRVLETTAIDTLALPNTVARNRTLAYIVEVARRCHESDQERRIAVLETALHDQTLEVPEVVDLEPDLLGDDTEEVET